MIRSSRDSIIEEETTILGLVINDPGKWTLSALSEELGTPTSALKARVRHLRDAGYFTPLARKLTVTDDGRVAYYKRLRLRE